MATETITKQNQLEKIDSFRRLHIPGKPIVLYNIWDAGSAQAVAKSGARAIATSSWAVAKSHGFNDGEQFPFELAIQNLRQIVGAVPLPVTFDIESGYGEEPEAVGASISLAIQAGAVGCNFEDSFPANGKVRDIAIQVNRLQAARKAAAALSVPFFLNARCDLFFQGDSVPHDEKLLQQVLDRAYAYAQAGADGLFIPGLTAIPLIAELAKKSPIPLNILADLTTSLKMLADNCVSRVSYGAAPYVESINALEKAARAINS